MDASSPLGFLGVALELAAVDLLLGGDNAILIALASRTLSPALRTRAMIYAVGGAIVLRFALAGIAGFLMQIPFIKLGGAVVLMAIAVELLAHAHSGAKQQNEPDGAQVYDDRFWRAVVAIMSADAVMSLDNVLALASIAQGNLPLLALGIALGIPALAFGSLLVAKVLDRWPILVIVGAALLGWVAGQMAATDAIWETFVRARAPALVYIVPALGAAFVVVWGRFGPRRKTPPPSPPGVIPPKAKKAIDYLYTAKWRQPRVLAGAIALVVAIGAILLIILKMRA
jgi:YjbE family integral membrane protein